MLPVTQDIVVNKQEKPHILGTNLREVYITLKIKYSKKLCKNARKQKKLDFLVKNVIMSTKRKNANVSDCNQMILSESY